MLWAFVFSLCSGAVHRLNPADGCLSGDQTQKPKISLANDYLIFFREGFPTIFLIWSTFLASSHDQDDSTSAGQSHALGTNGMGPTQSPQLCLCHWWSKERPDMGWAESEAGVWANVSEKESRVQQSLTNMQDGCWKVLRGRSCVATIIWDKSPNKWGQRCFRFGLWLRWNTQTKKGVKTSAVVMVWGWDNQGNWAKC